MRIIRVEDLPATSFSRELIGDDHGGTSVSIIFVEAPPGSGPSLHTHPYEPAVRHGVARVASSFGCY
jgi:quercetin dioxygenase-like cupin family protein